MARNKSKAKGNRLERRVVAMAREAGKSATRAWGSDGRSLGEHAEVDVVIDGQTFQCKSRKKIAGYMRPSDNVDGQIIMQNRGEPLVVFRLKDFLNA